MALLPLMFDDDLFGHPRKWSSFLEPEELCWPTATFSRGVNLHHLRDLRHQLPRVDKNTSIIVDKDHFQANIDVQQFEPYEISVKLTGDNTVTVEGKHEEKEDDHGTICRHFVRRYQLPEDCDVARLQSKLSSDGVLTISAPKKRDDKEVELNEIPIHHTWRPRLNWWPSRSHSVSGHI
ncbi:alpha-crystallin B chain-like [Cylas formicarius]|uniref:alpha-crystallin B chain-like n=1 Tax=Cylas formicarius TaxID=197179 RepID=UPI002958C324|nr:alpha-crystallin B chain-like [Cylas formicarius]